ncbi:MAG: imidazole glycerol phosphate synthase subunit HisH [Bacteroidota bacterium]|jgi:glutamine amidotransferase
MEIAIIRYNAGNTRSVSNALQRLGFNARVTGDAAAIRAADRVIFPGVGEAGAAMQYLREQGLAAVIASLVQPVLGICLGMQLLADNSEESNTRCLGIIPASVARLSHGSENGEKIKVPHMGWNQVDLLREHPLFEGISSPAHFYFVHGFAMELNPCSIATATHGATFTAAVQCRNFWGVQFHPEKSAAAGERLLLNFLKNAG